MSLVPNRCRCTYRNRMKQGRRLKPSSLEGSPQLTHTHTHQRLLVDWCWFRLVATSFVGWFVGWDGSPPLVRKACEKLWFDPWKASPGPWRILGNLCGSFLAQSPWSFDSCEDKKDHESSEQLGGHFRILYMLYRFILFTATCVKQYRTHYIVLFFLGMCSSDSRIHSPLLACIAWLRDWQVCREPNLGWGLCRLDIPAYLHFFVLGNICLK